MSSLLVAGAGPVALPTAIELLKRGHSVTLVADKTAGEGITGDFAAGIGCIFKPSCKLISDFVIASYEANMKLARDKACPSVRLTRLRVETRGQEQSYASLVEDFFVDSPTHASYTTFAFDPVGWGKQRLEEFIALGGKLEHRALSAKEIAGIRSGEGVSGFDYVHDATGLNARNWRPSAGLYPIRGVLVHFPATDDIHSFMDEEDAIYVIRRPNGDVVGGTFNEGVHTCSPDEELRIAARIVSESNKRWDLGLDLNERTRITVGFRPGIQSGEPLLEFGDKVSAENGFGGQGWITWYARVNHVVPQIEAKLA